MLARFITAANLIYGIYHAIIPTHSNYATHHRNTKYIQRQIRSGPGVPSEVTRRCTKALLGAENAEVLCSVRCPALAQVITYVS